MTIELGHKGSRCDKTSFASEVWNWSGRGVKFAGVKFQCVVRCWAHVHRFIMLGWFLLEPQMIKKKKNTLRFFFSRAPLKLKTAKMLFTSYDLAFSGNSLHHPPPSPFTYTGAHTHTHSSFHTSHSQIRRETSENLPLPLFLNMYVVLCVKLKRLRIFIGTLVAIRGRGWN